MDAVQLVLFQGQLMHLKISWYLLYRVGWIVRKVHACAMGWLAKNGFVSKKFKNYMMRVLYCELCSVHAVFNRAMDDIVSRRRA